MSHFSTVKTQLRKREPLLQALLQLGYVPEEGHQLVRGYRGQTVQAEMAVKMPEGGDVGFRWNPSTTAYELVTDLETWKQPIPPERFIDKVTQQYARMTIHSAVKEMGLVVDEEWEMDDNSIELTVTQWN